MSNFTDKIKKFAISSHEDAKKIIEKVRVDVSESVINKTPLDTGFARGNWQSSVGSSITTEITRFDREAGFAPTSGDGIAVREAIETASKDIDKDFYITNNAEYIRNLEFGGSDQAPRGMVRITVADFQNIVAEAVKSLK